MNKLTWIILAFTSGAFLPIQAGINNKLGKAGASPLHASMISFIIGAATVALFILIFRQNVSWTGLKNTPAYTWLGGALGAFYVTVIILAFPKLGPALTFSLVVAGQMFISAVLEHYHILDAKQNPINLIRLIGLTLIIAGVILIRKF